MFRLSHQRRFGGGSALSRYAETLGELTLRRQTELAMTAAKAESDLANRAKSAFLGTMSHELRTPLNAIIGFSDLIRGGKPDAESAMRGAEYAGHIGDAGRHLLEVVSDILDISKIESGTFTLNLAPCRIADVIAECVPMIAQRIDEKRQRLTVHVDPELPQIEADARRVKQVLINLLSNANKFTPEGGRIVLAARGQPNGKGVVLAVVDSGVGMTADDIVTALSPFGQVQSHLSRTQEGTGLGLPIARGLAKEHGGDLTLTSEPGAGTSAVVTLPATRAAKTMELSA